MRTHHNITYRTLLTVCLLLGPARSAIAAPKPVWWPAAEKASHEAWTRSFACRCEQSFAVDLRGESIVIRVFKPIEPKRHASDYSVTPNTVAVFHTHLEDPEPSMRDRNLEAKYRLPFYVIHAGMIVESK